MERGQKMLQIKDQNWDKKVFEIKIEIRSYT